MFGIVMSGLIDRRILVNYRADPVVVAATLPAPFRPKLVQGSAMVGICLIRLQGIRPAFLPNWVGLGSENAAHRTAVEWNENGELREGVYVRRRDTSSRLNSLVGGRLFPGLHSHARFSVSESAPHFEVGLRSDDGQVEVQISTDLADRLPSGSVFSSLEEASAFFRAGSVGYSATLDSGRYEGLELFCPEWKMEPLTVSRVTSSWIEDRSVFPTGSVHFDSAFLMRDLAHEWHEREDLCCFESQRSDRPAIV